MSPPPICVLYSQDADLVRRIKAFLSVIAQLRHVADPDRLEAVLQQSSPALLLIDLRAREARDQLDLIRQNWPTVLIVALGTPRSEPAREAEQAGVYAVEDLQLDRRRVQALVTRAFDHLRVLQENQELRKDVPISVPSPLPPRQIEVSLDRRQTSTALLRFPRVFRRCDNVETLLENLVEGIADTTGVGRVGIFARAKPGEHYRLRAGLRCLPETREIEFSERDELLRWFESNAQIVFRNNLTNTADPSERTILRRALDLFGAEAIIPLHSQNRILGWLFFGRRATGQPFQFADLEALMMLAEHVATVLENAFLYEDVAVQKTLTDTLLNSIPPGIVAIDEEAIIRSFNPTAAELLGLGTDEILNHPAEAVGGRLGAFLRDTLDAKENLPARQWIDPNTRRSLSVETRRLLHERKPLGAVAVLHDLTIAENSREKQELVDRAAFWTDLAASMSHEIRNPLVAIKTFAQLLPERFDDADFRREFNEVVVQEIDRLDKIITEINNFAHPSELVMKPIDVREPVRKGIQRAQELLKRNEIPIDANLPNDLPPVFGDELALTEAFAQLVTNAAEAASGQSKPRVTLAVRPLRNGQHSDGVIVTVQDNGRGISPELKDKIFSPFCTTKARGMGLGLPIVKRTVFDHNGRVDVDTNSHGTSVSVLLPAPSNGQSD